MNDITNIEKVSGALVEFKAVDAGIAALRERFAGVLYDCTTKDGLEAAKAARAEVRAPRLQVEQIRKDAKKPLLELGRELDAEAKRITEALVAIEDPIDRQIKAEEARREEERQRKIREEAERVAAIRSRIDAIRGWPAQYAGKPSSLVALQIGEARNYLIDASFAEFQDEAARVLAQSIQLLETELAGAREREAEQARLKAEREELERLRLESERQAREQVERDRQAREERERIEAARRAQEQAARAVMEKLRTITSSAISASSADITQAIETITHMRFDPAAYGEYLVDVEKTRAASIEMLRQLHMGAIVREQQAAQAAAQAAERVTVTETVSPAVAYPVYPAPASLSAQVPSGIENVPRNGAIQQPTARDIIDVLCKHYGAGRADVIGWLREMFGTRTEAA